MPDDLARPVLSVVIPIYNEDTNIGALHQRLTDVLVALNLPGGYELLFVNDGSHDNSLALLRTLAVRDAHVRYFDLSRNFGHQIAVSAGLDQAEGEAVVIIDADLQDPPELIAELYTKLQAGYEVVYARRRSRQNENVAKRFTAKMFYRLLVAITHVAIPVDTGDFRIISRRVVLALRQMPEQHKFLRGQIAWLGFRQTFVEYDRAGRGGGTTGYTYRKMVRLALDGITSFSDAPLKAASMLGFAVSGVAFLLMVYTLYGRLVRHDYQPGWASLMMSILFLGGVQLIAVGIIGEYIARLSANVRQRPLYFIAEASPPSAGPGAGLP